MVLRRALVVAAALLAVVGGIALFQDQLLYFPQKAGVDEVAGGGLRAWPSEYDFRGLIAEPTAPARGTAIVFHGNAGHAGQRGFYAAALAPLGLRVILAEYPGYGPRAGEPGEAAFVADAVQTIERARREFGPPLLVIGESLGAGVAAGALRSRSDRVDALMLITPWDRLANVASHHYPWLPVRWLLRDGYDSAVNLARFDKPTWVVVAMRDDIVLPRFGEALHQALPGPRHLERLGGSGHNVWAGRVDAAWWRRAVDDLLGAARR